MKYVCAFRFNLMERKTRAECIAYFKEGFWINEEYQITLGDDCKFWIPPSQISYIEKEK